VVAFAAVEGGRHQDPGPCRPKARRSRVQRAESEQIVVAMKERGIDHEYAMYENEGHGYHRTDRFPAKHLGGPG
jgi:hypothetical protein